MEADSPAPLSRLDRVRAWWSGRMFPSDQPSPDVPLLPSLAALVLLGSLLFLGNLESPLLEPQEARYSEIPRQMLESESWVIPVLHGRPYLDKPPLFYWCVMAGYKTLGVHDWVGRAVVGLIGVLLVLVTFLWGRAVVGARAALCGAVVLCLSARFFYLQRMLTMDCLLCLCVVAALAAGHRAIRAGRLSWSWWMLSALMCGFGLLTKGPIVFVLVGAPLWLFVFLDRRQARPGILGWGAFVLGAVAVASPWYVAASVQHPGFAHEFFWKHHVLRFFEPFDHEKPFWYYGTDLVFGLFPWTIVLPGFLRFLGRGSRRIREHRPAALGLFLLCGLWPFAFFSASGCKRPLYIVPALPPLALALGCYLDVLVMGLAKNRSWQPLLRPSVRVARLAMLAMLVLGFGVVVAAGVRQMIPLYSVVLGVVLLSLALVMTLFFRAFASWASCALTAFLFLLTAVHFLLPAYAEQFSLRRDLFAHRALYSEETSRVVCYPRQYDSVSFYFPEAKIRVYSLSQREALVEYLRDHPRTLLLVKSGRVLEDLLPRLPKSVEFVSERRPGAVTVGWVRPRGEFDFRMAVRD